MSDREQMSISQLILGQGGVNIRVNVGSAATRALALAADPTQPIGSLYISTTGVIYQRTARTAGDATNTDMTKVSQTAAD